MEDAVDALKIAFAVFVFVLALSIVFSAFSLAREATDAVIMHTDKDFYKHWTSESEFTGDEGREVGVETVIPTLYRYFKEKFSVDIIRNGDIEEKFDEEIERGIDNNAWYTSDTTFRTKYGEYYKEGTTISVPWLGTSIFDADNLANRNLNKDIQTRVDLFISNKGGIIADVKVERYKGGNGLNWNAVYTERFRENYNGVRESTDDGATVDLIKGTTSLYITYEQQ